MSKFPEPIPLPHQVYEERIKRNKQIVKFATIGVSFRIAITLIELVGFLFTGSIVLYTDAVSTLADIVSTLFLLICIKLAQKPPDKDHPFGHGRYEPFGGFLLGVLLIVLGGIMLFQQFLDGIHDHPDHMIHSSAWLFPFVSVCLLEICYRLIMGEAKRQHSPALAAEAMHYRTDSVTSLIAMVTLLVVAYVPMWGGLIDHLGSILIAIFMVILGLYAARENLHQLVDKIPDSSFFSKVKDAAEKVRGVKGTEKIRIQSYGPDAHVDIDVEVEPQLTVELAHEISQQVRTEIQKAWPAVRDVTVHIEPYYANDH